MIAAYFDGIRWRPGRCLITVVDEGVARMEKKKLVDNHTDLYDVGEGGVKVILEGIPLKSS